MAIDWFDEYVWRFRVGKAGAGLAVTGAVLDFHSRIETLFKELALMPIAAAVLQSGWTHLLLIVAGFALLVRSTRAAKDTPRPKTIEQRAGDAEVQLDVIGRKVVGCEQRLTDLDTKMMPLRDAITEVPEFWRYQEWIKWLERELDEIIDGIVALVWMFPESEAAKYPFRAYQVGLTGPHPMSIERLEALRWAKRLTDHKDHYQIFFHDWHPGDTAMFQGELFRILDAWHSGQSDKTYNHCLQILRGHKSKLCEYRMAHATRFAQNALSTRSRVQIT
ncbi:MAG TPA: hypothetical protein VG456_17550 [Candidatus Sulfopaludibacter sp.]|nr:hypothetical protein [Candidatus Sulfopaludibacter sp.]